jgi:hypothetical protein
MAEETNGRKESIRCKKEGKKEKERKNTLPGKKKGGEGRERTVEGGKQEDILLNEDV